MPQLFEAIEIAPHFTLHVAPTDKFKTTSVRLVLHRPLRRETNTSTAVVPFVLRRGTETLPSSRDIARHLEHLYGTRFAVDIGKIGETQNVEFYVEATHDDFLPEQTGVTEAALSFLATVLLQPVREDGVFRSDFVTQEAQMLRRTIERTINNRPRYALNRLREVMCKEEPFGLHKYGDVESLGEVTPAALYGHYEHILAHSKVDLFVVGAVEPETMAAMVAEHFPLPRAQAVTSIAPPVDAPPRDVQVVTETEPVQQGVLALGYRTGVRYADDDYAALLVYNGILGGFPHSKLFLNVRERASLAYFASSQVDATKGVLVIAAGIAVDKYDEALRIVREQVDDMAAGHIDDAELEQTQKGLTNGIITGQDSPHRIIGGQLLGIVNGRPRSPEQLVDEVRAVTKADVERVAAQVAADTVYFLRGPEAH